MANIHFRDCPFLETYHLVCLNLSHCSLIHAVSALVRLIICERRACQKESAMLAPFPIHEKSKSQSAVEVEGFMHKKHKIS
jgi:hypothetical protein